MYKILPLALPETGHILLKEGLIDHLTYEDVNEGSRLGDIVNDVMHLVVGKRVLDVGTGFGTVISGLMNHSDFDIVSIDPEAWTFDRIEEEFSEKIDAGKLKLLKSRAESIPFEDDAFNTSMAICSIHHLPDPEIGLREIERVTSDRVIITDWDPSSAGTGHPHSPEELQRNKDSIMDFATRNGYESRELGKWFMIWK